MRWNIENFYRDGENFMIKTKTADFVVRYFFFLFISILYNLWYLVRAHSPITAQEWKDLVEDEITGKMMISLKFIPYMLHSKIYLALL